MSNKSNQALPPKEMALFRKTVRCYEQKQYKMALRCTKQILSNPQFSEHGETLAMRGLILNCVGKHEEAMEVVRRGLTADLKSYVCWHVFGQVQRSDKKYDEAMKAYKMALRLDNDNLQILRDLSLLQIQMRDYLGYRDSRYQLLVLRPGNKAHWVAYANACHMLGDHDMALRIIDDFLKNLMSNNGTDPERSDLILYKVTILQDASRLSEALDFLEENGAIMPDRLTYFETRAELLFKLGRIADAQSVYQILMRRNPDCVDYMKRVEECLSVLNADKSADEVQQIIQEFYDKLIAENPKTRVIQIRGLMFTRGEEFERRTLEFVVSGLRSGLPSLFNCLSAFYEDLDKVAFIEKYLRAFIAQSEQEGGYERASLDGSALPELPSTYVWTNYYLAQHYLKQGRASLALQSVEAAIRHTPTLVDLYTLKAKVLKHEKKPKEAADCMELAQSLDTADRYLNCKCTKYLLAAQLTEQAAKMCERFTREGMRSDDALYEMQCLWYPLACAKAYDAKGEFGEALKRCFQIDRTITSYYEEQYDFHTYCVRKCYMAPYVSMLKMLDSIHNNPYYIKAAKIAVRIYIRLFNNPEMLEEKPKPEESNFSASELKKYRRKANKQKAQAEKALEEQNNKLQQQQDKKKKGMDAEMDLVEAAPLDPKKLAATPHPLEEASKFLQPLIWTLDVKDPEFYALAFEVYVRRGKVLMMLRCLKRLRDLDNQAFLHAARNFAQNWSALREKCSKLVQEQIAELLPWVLPSLEEVQALGVQLSGLQVVQ